MAISIKQLATLAAIFLCFTTIAESLPEGPLGYVIQESDVIIEGKLKTYVSAKVTKVYKGNVKAGDLLVVNLPLKLPLFAYNTPQIPRRLLNEKYKFEKGLATEGQTIFLFLKRTKTKNEYDLALYGANIKWIINDKVYAYRQVKSPGPYQLLPSPEAKTPEQLRKLIHSEINNNYLIKASGQKKKKITFSLLLD